MVEKSFNSDNYASLIRLAQKSGYSICPVKYVRLQKNKPILMLRHDMDLDLNSGLQMAQLESKLGVRSTYFVLLFNDFYNPFTATSKEKIRAIQKMGHEIGIHWDERDYNAGANIFSRNKKLLEEIIDEEIVSASQHEPVETSFLRLGKRIRYETYRDFKDLTYISDSSMKWRKITPWDVIENGNDMQLLIHPFWWMMKGESLRKKFKNFKDLRLKSDSKLIDEYCRDTEEFLKVRDVLDEKYKKRIKSSF